MSETNLMRFGKGRIEALTDGLFAIAMTVLVLDIRPPHLPANFTEAHVWEAVLKMLPDFLAFSASFIILAMYWVGHHTLFRFLMQTDRTILWLNMYFLMFVSLVPFTTGFYSGDANSRIANVIFGSNLIIMGLLAYVTWGYARRTGHINPEVTKHSETFTTMRLLTAPVIAAVALIVALIQPVYAEFIYFAMIPIFMFATPRLKDQADPQAT